ncbi:MAG: DMT family transporter [Stappiaceae bacterium]
MKLSQKLLSLGTAPVAGAFWMASAGAIFAVVNVITQYATMTLGTASPVAAFWQYFFALIVLLPWLISQPMSHWRTRRPGLHLLRVVLAALGVQAWVAGLAWPVPIWQAIALIMTSPFFVTLGAAFLLKEPIGVHRLGATLVGFVGGMLILEPWSDAFHIGLLLPVLAAFLWAGSTLCLKRIADEESPEALTLYLLLLLSPINASLAFATGFTMPVGTALWLLAASGVLVGLAQGCLAMAYKRADAAYIQPFDHLKLPLNILAGWLVFQWAPAGHLWIGVSLILAASLFIMRYEAMGRRANQQTA